MDTLNAFNIGNGTTVKCRIDFDEELVTFLVNDIECARSKRLKELDSSNENNIKFGVFN